MTDHRTFHQAIAQNPIVVLNNPKHIVTIRRKWNG